MKEATVKPKRGLAWHSVDHKVANAAASCPIASDL
jgi:hypothetical protein